MRSIRHNAIIYAVLVCTMGSQILPANAVSEVTSETLEAPEPAESSEIVEEYSPCHFSPWQEYQHTALYSQEDEQRPSYYFVSDHVAIDADGAPNAYHPEDRGIDYLANAGYPDSSWWKNVLVVDPTNREVAYQQPTGQFQGYFVSKTALEDTSKSVLDVQRYVNASTVPYLVFPGNFYRQRGTGLMGDVGVAIHLSTGNMSGFVVADVGPRTAPLGEMSVKLAENLSKQAVNPKNGLGAPSGEILYVLFPYSAREYPWPLTVEALQQLPLSLLNDVGGKENLVLCSAREFDPA